MRIIIVFSFEGQIVEYKKKQQQLTHTGDRSLTRTFWQIGIMVVFFFLLLPFGANFHWSLLHGLFVGVLFIRAHFTCVGYVQRFFVCVCVCRRHVVVQHTVYTLVCCRALHAMNRWRQLIESPYTFSRYNTTAIHSTHVIYSIQECCFHLCDECICDKMKCLFCVGLTKVMVDADVLMPYFKRRYLIYCYVNTI